MEITGKLIKKFDIESGISKAGKEWNKQSILIEQNADLGTVLSWNPTTGSLQLTQAATQRLLASLGGRLAHRKERGLTIFFPIAETQN